MIFILESLIKVLGCRGSEHITDSKIPLYAGLCTHKALGRALLLIFLLELLAFLTFLGRRWRRGRRGRRAFEAVILVVDRVAYRGQVCRQWAIEAVVVGGTGERKVACSELIQVLELRGQGSG